MLSAASLAQPEDWISMGNMTTAGIREYHFQYLDVSDSILASFRINPLRRGREKVFGNITIPLIGIADDDAGNSTQKAIQIDNF